MEGDYLAPKPQETELPKFEEDLPAPEFVEETVQDNYQAKPALAGMVATEVLKNNPNPEVRKIATDETMGMDPELLLKQVQEAAERDLGIERTFEKSHERKDDPLMAAQDNSNASTRTIQDVPNEPVVAIMPVSEDEPTKQTVPVAEPQNLFAQQSEASLYKQAIVVGATTAVAILAIFITIKLT